MGILIWWVSIDQHFVIDRKRLNHFRPSLLLRMCRYRPFQWSHYPELFFVHQVVHEACECARRCRESFYQTSEQKLGCGTTCFADCKDLASTLATVDQNHRR